MSTILVVDDSDVIRQTLVRLLKREGYEALGANCGREALDILATHIPDLILLDIMMPDIDGLELLERIQAKPEWKTIPVIMMTAVSDTQTIRRCELLGAREYLVKATFSVSDMLQHVRNFLDGSQLQMAG
jgi:adenylate cyclase